VLPFYLSLLGEYQAEMLAVLRIWRLVRIFRIFKMASVTDSIALFSNTITDSTMAMNLLLSYIGISMVVFGALIYFAVKDCYYLI
jgi:hypothetical protein